MNAWRSIRRASITQLLLVRTCCPSSHKRTNKPTDKFESIELDGTYNEPIVGTPHNVWSGTLFARADSFTCSNSLTIFSSNINCPDINLDKIAEVNVTTIQNLKSTPNRTKQTEWMDDHFNYHHDLSKRKLRNWLQIPFSNGMILSVWPHNFRSIENSEWMDSVYRTKLMAHHFHNIIIAISVSSTWNCIKSNNDLVCDATNKPNYHVCMCVYACAFNSTPFYLEREQKAHELIE